MTVARRGDRRGLIAELRRAASSGRLTRTLAALDGLVQADPGDLAWPLERMRVRARARDHEPAIADARAVLSAAPRAANVWMELANLLAGAGRTGEVAAAVERAVELAPGEAPYRWEAARLLADADDLDAARRHASAPEAGPRGRVLLGQFAAWSGDHGAALEGASTPGADPSEAACLRAAVALAERRIDDARAHAGAALERDPTCAEALLVRAETSVALGRAELADPDMDRAIESTPAYLPAASILRLVCAAASPLGPGPQTLGRVAVEEVRQAVEELIPGAPDLAECHRDHARDVLLAALEQMHGNRSAIPTRIDAGRPRRLAARTSPRHASRRALELIRVAPPARAVAALSAVVDRYPRSSLPVCHRGELHLWLGDVAAARADFEAAIARTRGTRFAWIGLAGVCLLEGRPLEALDVLAEGVRTMHGTEGPAVFVYRGEALLRLGRVAEARVDLERAASLRSERTGAWILLAIARRRQGDAAGARAAIERVRLSVPALLEDAAAEALGRPARDDDDMIRALERAVEMLRGNRSSTCVTYFTASGEICALERRGRP